MECSICLETIHNTAFYTNCKCKSTIYHKDCIQKWLSLSRSCPFCKHIFPDMPKKGKYNQNLIDKALFLDTIHSYPTIDLEYTQLNSIYDQLQ